MATPDLRQLPVRLDLAPAESGLGFALRALRANSALVQTVADLRSAEAAERTARRSLAALIGLDTPPAELIDSDPAAMPEAIDPRTTLDVRLAETQRAIAEARLGSARAEGRVDPSVGVGVRQISETGDRALVASLSLPLPIFDRNQGNVAAARSDITASVARRDDAILTAQAEIANGEAQLASAEARLAALEGSAIEQAREAVRLAELSYRAGKSSLVEYLDAQQAYAETQAALIAARRARAEARARARATVALTRAGRQTQGGVRLSREAGTARGGPGRALAQRPQHRRDRRDGGGDHPRRRRRDADHAHDPAVRHRGQRPGRPDRDRDAPVVPGG